ncbi:MAG: alcohol dehydrogenase [Proteobacteria bacterium]|nr:alcohol dehydrogenase [Pseudomonadota bacterium]
MNQSTMKAVVYHGPKHISLDDVPIPQMIERDDAIVKVTTSTICGTDIHIQAGGLTDMKPGTIIGHEFCGEIVELGPRVHGFEVGDRVAVSCVTQCGVCYYCVRQEYSHCVSGSWIFGYQIDGCQAEYVRVPHATLGMHKIPEGLTDEDLLFVGDILSTGYFGAERGRIRPGDSVVVVGSGPVGMCAMASARLWGPSQIIAVDTNAHRLEVCKAQGLADLTLNPADTNVQKIRDWTDGRGADVAIEAVGAEPTLSLALDIVRPGGNVSVIGVFTRPIVVKMQDYWIKNINISMGLVQANHIPLLIDLIKKGKINLKFLQTHRAPLNDILQGYDVFGKKKDNCLKWIVTPYIH